MSEADNRKQLRRGFFSGKKAATKIAPKITGKSGKPTKDKNFIKAFKGGERGNEISVRFIKNFFLAFKNFSSELIEK